MIDSDDANSLQQQHLRQPPYYLQKAEEDEITTQEGSKRLAEERIRKAKAIKGKLRGIKGWKIRFNLPITNFAGECFQLPL